VWKLWMWNDFIQILAPDNTTGVAAAQLNRSEPF
jgi:hypothetical protein